MQDFDPDDVVYMDGNSTRKATEDELREVFGFHKCADDDCSAEKNALGIESAVIRGYPKTTPAKVQALTTTQILETITPSPVAIPDTRVTSAMLPLITGMPSDELGGQRELRDFVDRDAQIPDLGFL